MNSTRKPYPRGAAPPPIDRMDFSIVVPFFNAGPYIERCVRGLVAQTYPAERYEVLLVDNNSTDGSDALVRQFAGVKLLTERLQGSYAARNRGLAEARGDIVAFTDPDCVPREDWLEQIARAMAEPGVAVVQGDRLFASDTGVVGSLAAYESALSARIFQTRAADSYYGYTNNMAARTAVLRAFGGFETRDRGADTVFLRAVASKYGESAVAYAPEMLVRHLEIASIGDYLRKKAIYGRVNRDPAVSPGRALSLRTRLALAARVARDRGTPMAGTIGFLGALAAGAIRFEWERRSSGGRWH